MAYVMGIARNQTMLLPAAVEDYISPENPVRAIDAFVDSLDLKQMGFRLREKGDVGRDGYHPGTLLKLYLWGYFSRTRSSRRLEEACEVNLNAIWLTGDLHPDHSTISDFRKNHASLLKQIFKQFNLLCMELELFSKELVAIDGTFIKAVNSKARSFTKTKLTKLMESIDKAVAKYLLELESADKKEQQATLNERVQKLPAKIEKMNKRRGELEELLKQCEESKTGQINLTDPESRQLRKNGQATVGYNVQTAVDDKHHMIASCEVTQEANDLHLLDQMAQQAKADLNLQEDADLTVLADKGYGCPVEFAACQEHQTQACVPMQKTPEAGDGSILEKDFSYQAQSDSYRCPEGKTLPRKADDMGDNGTGYRVYYEAKQCRNCPVLNRCTKGNYRKFRVNIHKAAMDAVQGRLKANPKLYAKRSALVEHPFGTIKDWNGGKDLLCRGLELAETETRLSFWAYNFKRALKVLGIKALMEGIGEWQEATAG